MLAHRRKIAAAVACAPRIPSGWLCVTSAERFAISRTSSRVEYAKPIGLTRIAEPLVHTARAEVSAGWTDLFASVQGLHGVAAYRAGEVCSCRSSCRWRGKRLVWAWLQLWRHLFRWTDDQWIDARPVSLNNDEAGHQFGFGQLLQKGLQRLRLHARARVACQ